MFNLLFRLYFYVSFTVILFFYKKKFNFKSKVNKSRNSFKSKENISRNKIHTKLIVLNMRVIENETKIFRRKFWFRLK